MTETTIWDIEEHRKEPPGIRNLDFRESFDHLADYLDGYNIREPRTFDPENGGNPLMVRSGDGFYVGGSLNMLRDDPDSPLFDCEIQKIWDENGHLFLTGAHHDGSVRVELRQLTNDGAEAYETIRDAMDSSEQFTINGKTYGGTYQSIIYALRDLWNDPDLAEVPRYMEKAFGCPAEEYEEPKHPKEQAQTVSLSAEAKSAKESSTQLAQNHGNTAPAHETAR